MCVSFNNAVDAGVTSKTEGSKWQLYNTVNLAYVQPVVQNCNDSDCVFVFDLELLMAPTLIGSRARTANICFFFNTPFPSAEIFRTIPVRKVCFLLVASLCRFLRSMDDSIDRLECGFPCNKIVCSNFLAQYHEHLARAAMSVGLVLTLKNSCILAHSLPFLLSLSNFFSTHFFLSPLVKISHQFLLERIFWLCIPFYTHPSPLTTPDPHDPLPPSSFPFLRRFVCQPI